MRNRMGSSLNLDTTVVGLQGLPISTTPPTSGQALVFDGTNWVPTTVDTGTGGPFLPLTGGVLNNPGALTVTEVLTCGPSPSRGDTALINMLGAVATVQAANGPLILQQFGDADGSSYIMVENNGSVHGLLISSASVELAQVYMQVDSGLTLSLQLDGINDTNGVFEVLLSGNNIFAIDSAGNANFFGTATLVGNATTALEAVPLQQLDAAIAAIPTFPASVVDAPVVFFFPGLPAANQIIPVKMAFSVTIANLFAGSQVYVGTNPTAAAVFNVLSNGTSFGTASISTAGAVTWTGGAWALNAGDTLELQAPATQDTTLANVSFTILAVRA